MPLAAVLAAAVEVEAETAAANKPLLVESPMVGPNPAFLCHTFPICAEDKFFCGEGFPLAMWGWKPNAGKVDPHPREAGYGE